MFRTSSSISISSPILAYLPQVFAGKRNEATTLEEIVAHMEELYGRAGRVRMMDRGLASEKNVRFFSVKP